MQMIRGLVFFLLMSGFVLSGSNIPLIACELSPTNFSCAPEQFESTPNPFFGQVPLFNNHDFRLGFMGQPDFPMDFGNMRTWKSSIEKQFHLDKRPDNHFYLFHGSMPF